MNKDEIIELARQAGLDPDLWNYTDAFETFAVLVAQHEREACAKRLEAVGAAHCAENIRARGQE